MFNTSLEAHEPVRKCETIEILQSFIASDRLKLFFCKLL